MPLPNDEKLIALSEEILSAFEKVFGPHPGFRPVHAKGMMLTGTFTPSAEAVSLTRAQHAVQTSTPVTVRFSDSTGLPLVPDTDMGADPRGFAIRFNLAEHVHTDIVAHSANAFPATDGREFLEFLRAVTQEDKAKVQEFVGSHPKALAFVQAITPLPVSFAQEKYFGLTAMKFTNKDGVSRFGRYTIAPEDEVAHLSAEDAAAKSPNYLFDELTERLGKGPIRFRITVQVAEDGDVVNDVTVHWPQNRKVVEFGTLELKDPVADNAHEQKQIIFDPIPRLDGIEPSDDPLLELRAAVYLISGRRRRAAPEQ
ncbi:catalase family peroxidase [Edaphobacter sp. 12200R-103]|jgi:catalase|uniref:catalase family peroxidase n=1 Tax=Edaphobacter sp. 12200R-103 TaxID=2703788 RepID=UPI00138CAE16|nr:catalase family peroxidase [Edaphobacter sp. 12200R-103]QHS51246.1 catalase family peroxidase [Edaphobacter sp. 12200R-103]